MEWISNNLKEILPSTGDTAESNTVSVTTSPQRPARAPDALPGASQASTASDPWNLSQYLSSSTFGFGRETADSPPASPSRDEFDPQGDASPTDPSQSPIRGNPTAEDIVEAVHHARKSVTAYLSSSLAAFQSSGNSDGSKLGLPAEGYEVQGSRADGPELPESANRRQQASRSSSMDLAQNLGITDERVEAVKTTLNTWVEGATDIFTTAKAGLETQIGELMSNGSSTDSLLIPNDPLTGLCSDVEALKSTLVDFKREASSIVDCCEKYKELGDPEFEKSAAKVIGETGSCGEALESALAKYSELGRDYRSKSARELKHSAAKFAASIDQQIANLNRVFALFSSRARLFTALADLTAKVERKKNRIDELSSSNSSRSVVDNKLVDEYRELKRTLEIQESDYRGATAELVKECNDIVGRRGEVLSGSLSGLLQLQMAFGDSVSGARLNPVVRLLESDSRNTNGIGSYQHPPSAYSAESWINKTPKAEVENSMSGSVEAIGTSTSVPLTPHVPIPDMSPKKTSERQAKQRQLLVEHDSEFA